MTRMMIEETYSVQELELKKREIKAKLENPLLGEDEKWELNDLLERINKRIRLMTDLLVGFQVTY